MELLCEKVLSSTSMGLSPGDGLRRVFECISSGILLPHGPGLLDPCEKDPVDAAAYLTPQQREEITASAQVNIAVFLCPLSLICCISHGLRKLMKKRLHMKQT